MKTHLTLAFAVEDDQTVQAYDVAVYYTQEFNDMTVREFMRMPLPLYTKKMESCPYYVSGDYIGLECSGLVFMPIVGIDQYSERDLLIMKVFADDAGDGDCYDNIKRIYLSNMPFSHAITNTMTMRELVDYINNPDSVLTEVVYDRDYKSVYTLHAMYMNSPKKETMQFGEWVATYFLTNGLSKEFNEIFCSTEHETFELVEQWLSTNSYSNGHIPMPLVKE